MTPRLIALDIDGTLVGSDDRISARTLTAIHRARDSGAIIVLASGRRMKAVLPVARELKVSAPLICLNGALVVDSRDLSPMRMTPLDPRTTRRLIGAIHGIPLCALAYHYSVTPPDVYYQLPPHHAALASYLSAEGEHIIMVRNLEAHSHGAMRILTMGSVDEVTAAGIVCREAVNDGEAWLLETTFKGTRYLEIYPPGISKGKALTDLAVNLGIPLSQVLAFGDGSNDLDLLEVAGIGVAMGNAVDEAKAAANRITASQAEDGVAIVLEELFT